MKHSFGSDNHSGIHPQILQAIQAANNGFSIAYGEDTLSEKVLRQIEDMLGGNCSAFFVMTGTGANILSLSSIVHSSDAILCPSTAHINVDECGAPEKFIGCKIVPINHINGKVYPEEVKKHLTGFGFQHHSQPKVLSISQATELGTVYSPSEIKKLADLMHEHNCLLHLDGARIANAAAALNLSIKELTADLGVDALSFGGTKNGLLMGEVIVLFSSIPTEKVLYLRKQLSQLYSKSRYIAAQFEEYLKDDLYLSLAKHANSMAKYLEKRLGEISYINITSPVESNAVFAIIPRNVYEIISKDHFFYIWNEETMEVRWMCSFSTLKEDIDNFITDLKKIKI